MGLAEHQKLVARLATDASYRKQCFADLDGLGSLLGLEAEDTRRLAREVERFAASLVHKRRGEVQKLLPLTRLALGEKCFSASFSRFARDFVPHGVKKHRDDAIAFAKALQMSNATGAAWVVDLIRYESMMLQTTEPRRRFMVRQFQYSLTDLVEAATVEQPAPEPRMTLAVWLRLSRCGRVWHARLPLPRWMNWHYLRRSGQRAARIVS